MAATTMQQDERSPFLGPYAGASSEAGTPATADASSKVDTLAADNMTGLDSTPPKALSRFQNRKRILVSRPVYPVIQCVGKRLDSTFVAPFRACMYFRGPLGVWSPRALNSIVI